MHIEHFEKGIIWNDRELLLLAKKIGRLATYCKRLKDDGSRIRIEAEGRDTKKRSDSIKVMMTVELPHAVLRAESRKNNILDAVDSCIEKLEPQIKRYKELHTGRGSASKGRRPRGGERV